MKQLTVLLPALIVGAVFFTPVAAHADDAPGPQYIDSSSVDCHDETITETYLTVTETPEGTVTEYSIARYVMINYEFYAQCPGLEFVTPTEEEQGGPVVITGTVTGDEPIPVPESPSHTYSELPQDPTAPTTPSGVAPAPVVAPAPITMPAVVVPVSDPPKIGLYGDWKKLGA